MPKLVEEPMEILQIRLFKSDLATLRAIFGQTLGVNRAVRTIVRTYIRQVEAKTAAAIDRAEPLNANDEVSADDSAVLKTLKAIESWGTDDPSAQ